jgi:hypothetical protein
MQLPPRLLQRATVCLVTIMGAVTLHELIHIVVGHALGIGGHFTGLTSADADPASAAQATAGARAWMAGAAPLFTALTGVAALLLAPRARRQGYRGLATVLGWIAIFGIPYIGVQLMTLGGPARGVDTAAVLVEYFGIAGMPRVALAVGGVVFLLMAGSCLGAALGDSQPAKPAGLPAVAEISAVRRTIADALAAVSVGLIALGGGWLMRHGHGNPMGPFLLADILWGAGMLIKAPWQRPGPRFVWDVWLAPAIAAMGLLTLLGIVWPSDYTAAGLFFLPQLATAAYAARHRIFHAATPAVERPALDITPRAV